MTLVDLNVFLYPRTVFRISPKVENNLGIVAILVELPIFIVHFISEIALIITIAY